MSIDAEGYSGNEVPPAAHGAVNRRSLAAGAVRALATLAAAAPLAGATGCSPQPQRNPRQDGSLLAAALETQYQAVHAYGRALPLLRPAERGLVASLRAQESEHAAALRRLVSELGRTPPRPLTSSEYDEQLPPLQTRTDALRLLRDVENLEIRTLLLALARVTDPALRRPIIALAAAEAAQAMTLERVDGASAPARVFITGRPQG